MKIEQAPSVEEYKYGRHQPMGPSFMQPRRFPGFEPMFEAVKYQFEHNSSRVHSAKWQGSDIANRPEMAMHELLNISFVVGMNYMDLEPYRFYIQPNLPWADDHFLERVCGEPINPGIQWEKWPYAGSAKTFLDENGKFNHNYMERYWPKLAGRVHAPTRTAEDFDTAWRQGLRGGQNEGIKYTYGDLRDVVKLLVEDPYTRQAYLPVWFPEDTGGGSKRAPCTIGYWFAMRDDRLHVRYGIRSCDYIRHFRDDIYLTLRLALWIIMECRSVDSRWDTVRLGDFTMDIGSFHMFRNDYINLFGNK